MFRVRIGQKYFGFAKNSLLCLALVGMAGIGLPAQSQEYTFKIRSLLSEAKKMLADGKFASARMQYNEALRLEPNCPEAYNGLGLCAMNEGNAVESDKCFLSAINLKADYYDSLFNLANNLYVEGKYSDAISYYGRAIKVKEKSGLKVDPDALTMLATVYRDRAATLSGQDRLNDTARALDFYHKALAIKPDHFKAHAMLGCLYLDERQYPAAEKELRTAISLQPDYAYAYYVLGTLYVQRKEFPAALVAFHSSLKYEKVDRYKEKTKSQMMELGIPEQDVDHFAQGYEELNAGSLDTAQSEFEAASAGDGLMKAIALNNLGFVQARQGNLPLAIESYNKAIKLKPHGNPEFYYNLGQALFQLKKNAEAEKAFRQCLVEAHGNHYLAHNALGLVLKARGDLEEALNQYHLAMMQSSNALSVVQFNRGILLEKMGRKEEAAQSYREYLQSAPTGLNVASAKERLSHLAK